MDRAADIGFGSEECTLRASSFNAAVDQKNIINSNILNWIERSPISLWLCARRTGAGAEARSCAVQYAKKVISRKPASL
jgi:hypothetical protein